jgi:hypothetical protein
MKGLTVLLLTLVFSLDAQFNREPENGGMLIPGPYSRSAIIRWSPLPNAVSYEYVMSDNPNCFVGCSGDTRQKTVSDTTAIEVNMQENVWYYWIVRTYFNDNSDSGWSGVYSFRTLFDESEKVFELYPVPGIGSDLSFRIDWSVDPSLSYFAVEVYDLFGKQLHGSDFFTRSNGTFKYEVFKANLPELRSGMYQVVVQFYTYQDRVSNRVVRKYQVW